MINLYQLIKEIPKADLHSHFEATLPVNFVEKKFGKKLHIPNKYNDLGHFVQFYHQTFDKHLSLEEIEEGAYEICMQAKEHNVMHLELKTMIILNHHPDLDLWNAISTGMKKAQIELKKQGFIQTGGLHIVMVKKPEDYKEEEFEKGINNLKTAIKDNKYNILAVDIVGDEKSKSFSDPQIKRFLNCAKDNRLNITIHAGEVASDPGLNFSSSESIKSALDAGAQRIGHGIYSIKDEAIMNRLRDNKICLEICPTSNININNLRSFKELPIKKMMDHGIKVTINTDDQNLLDTNYTNEFVKLVENGIITRWLEIKQLSINGIENSFLPQTQKEEMKILFEKKFHSIEKEYGSEIEKYFTPERLILEKIDSKASSSLTSLTQHPKSYNTQEKEIEGGNNNIAPAIRF